MDYIDRRIRGKRIVPKGDALVLDHAQLLVTPSSSGVRSRAPLWLAVGVPAAPLFPANPTEQAAALLPGYNDIHDFPVVATQAAVVQVPGSRLARAERRCGSICTFCSFFEKSFRRTTEDD